MKNLQPKENFMVAPVAVLLAMIILGGSYFKSSVNIIDLPFRVTDEHQGVTLADKCRSIDKGDQPPAAYSGACLPVKVENAVTMTKDRRVRPQALVFDDDWRSVARLVAD